MTGETRLPWSEWFAALQDPRVTIRFETYGYLPMVPQWRFENRRVRELLVYRVLDSELRGEASGRTFRLEPTGTCLLPPGVRHTFEHDPSSPVSLQYFRVELKLDGRRLILDNQPMVLESAPDLGDDFERLHDDYESDHADHADRAARVRASLVLLTSSARRLSEAAVQDAGTLTVAQRERVYSFVREHRSSRLQPDSLARELDFSLDYFSRLFRQTYGIPPRQWLVRERIRHAAVQLDETTVSISQIAAQLGYPDVYGFSRQFKLVIGVSPRTYRQRSSRDGTPTRQPR